MKNFSLILVLFVLLVLPASVFALFGPDQFFVIDFDNNNEVVNLEDLNNVSVTPPLVSQVLTWDGNNWEPQTPAAGGGNDTNVWSSFWLQPDTNILVSDWNFGHNNIFGSNNPFAVDLLQGIDAAIVVSDATWTVQLASVANAAGVYVTDIIGDEIWIGDGGTHGIDIVTAASGIPALHATDGIFDVYLADDTANSSGISIFGTGNTVLLVDEASQYGINIDTAFTGDIGLFVDDGANEVYVGADGVGSGIFIDNGIDFVALMNNSSGIDVSTVSNNFVSIVVDNNIDMGATWANNAADPIQLQDYVTLNYFNSNLPSGITDTNVWTEKWLADDNSLVSDWNFGNSKIFGSDLDANIEIFGGVVTLDIQDNGTGMPGVRVGEGFEAHLASDLGPSGVFSAGEFSDTYWTVTLADFANAAITATDGTETVTILDGMFGVNSDTSGSGVTAGLFTDGFFSVYLADTAQEGTLTGGAGTFIDLVGGDLVNIHDGTYGIDVNTSASGLTSINVDNNITMTRTWINDLNNPIQPQDAATKFYVDAQIGPDTNNLWSASGTDIFNSNSGNVGIGTSTPSHELSVIGHVSIEHVADGVDDHGLEIDLNAAGFGDNKAIEISYNTGAIGAGADDGIILINIDQSQATAGDVAAVKILTTQGSAIIHGIEFGVLVNPIEQFSGVFGNMDSALVNATNRLTEFTTPGSNIALFVADNDTVTIGDASKFQEIEFLLATTSSGGGIAPDFEYSTGVGTWASFVPVDGTNGLRNNGTILWSLDNISGWVVGTGSEFLIRITRTRNMLTTVPVEDLVQISTARKYGWDELGDLNVSSVMVDDNIFMTDTWINDLRDPIQAQDAATKNYCDALVPLTTKGDVLTRDASTNVRLGVGSNDQVLTADSSTASGLKWATPAAGGTRSYGEMTVSSSAPTTITTGGTFQLLLGTTTLGEATNFTMPANNVLNYEGATTHRFLVTISTSIESNHKDKFMMFRIAKNGTTIASTEIKQETFDKIQDDEQSVSLNHIVELEQDSNLSLFGSYESGEDGQTLEAIKMVFSVIQIS